jgi:hypothetical protein
VIKEEELPVADDDGGVDVFVTFRHLLAADRTLSKLTSRL